MTTCESLIYGRGKNQQLALPQGHTQTLHPQGASAPPTQREENVVDKVLTSYHLVLSKQPSYYYYFFIPHI